MNVGNNTEVRVVELLQRRFMHALEWSSRGLTDEQIHEVQMLKCRAEPGRTPGPTAGEGAASVHSPPAAAVMTRGPRRPEAEREEHSASGRLVGGSPKRVWHSILHSSIGMWTLSLIHVHGKLDKLGGWACHRPSTVAQAIEAFQA